MQEKIVQTKQCKHCNISFKITDNDLEFFEKTSPIFKGKKYLLPTPTLCSDCRLQSKLLFRNERNIYKRKCDLTWKDILSVYSEDKPFTIYNQKDWESDKFDPMEYWINVDFNKWFFEQFKKLYTKIPKMALHLDSTMENCDYCNYWQSSKDCYLCFSAVWSEKCMYSQMAISCNNDVDWIFNVQNQYCYDCIHCTNWYKLKHCNYSNDCKNSYFLLDCVSCEFCFWCVNLQQKKYYFLNEQLSKEDYENKIKEIVWNYEKLEQFIEKYKKFILNYPRVNLKNINSENCIWDFIQNSKDSINCFSILWWENFKDTYFSWYASDLHSCVFAWDQSSLIYECIWTSRCNKTAFSFFWRDNKNCYYCNVTDSCSDCFLCEWLKHKQYCILNKQYTKEQYENLVPKIIEKM